MKNTVSYFAKLTTPDSSKCGKKRKNGIYNQNLSS